MRVLGLDLGTNSIGWAIIDEVGQRTTLVDKGSIIFEKGVGEEKNVEFSRATERTKYRSARRIKFRRKLRKLETLNVLSKHGLCPALSEADLNNWRYKKQYPSSTEFRSWLSCVKLDEDPNNRSPYYCRYFAITKKMDLDLAGDREILGRALYHIAQRRGYKSNRVSGEDKEGAVDGAIKELQEKMNGRTLGQYYYEECIGSEPVRGVGHYTSRKDYADEFARICEFQGFSAELREELNRAIFFQRPLKSQKGGVGKCLLEPRKARAPVSHPLFERFRMLQFVNNIKVREPICSTDEPRLLNDRERKIAISWLSTREENEKFERLAKHILPKRTQIEYGGKWRESDNNSWVFNYRNDMTAPGSSVSALLIEIFGENWRDALFERYEKRAGKTKDQVVDDIWHAMFSFIDDSKLMEFFISNLHVSNEESKKLCKPLPRGYGNLSLKAIRNILAWLEKGMIYPQAVFLAKLPEIFLKKGLAWDVNEASAEEIIECVMNSHSLDSAIENSVNGVIKNLRSGEYNEGNDVLFQVPENISLFRDQMTAVIQSEYGERRWLKMSELEQGAAINRAVELLKSNAVKNKGQGQFIKNKTLDLRIKSALSDKFGFSFSQDEEDKDGDLDVLYHPSANDCYPAAEGDRLGSPRIESIKNPVFMRAMTILRELINALIEDDVIDRNTRVRVEMARDLNNFNDRAAWYRYQRERESARKGYADRIKECGYEVNPSNLLKYQLWNEQGEMCLYTGKSIGLHDFLSENPVYEIEHTIPRSRRLDNSQENLTLCEMHYNHSIKRNFIPQELGDANAIYQRALHTYQPKIDALESQIERSRSASRSAQEKDVKDAARQKFLKAKMERNYWYGKLKRFELTEPPNGFTNNQLVDTRIISKYAFLYLKSYFERVETLKAGVVSEVKDIWGLKDKSRDNHVHHAIDAVVVACFNKGFYDQLAHYYEKFERFNKHGEPVPDAPLPWEGFDCYLNSQIQNEILVPHLHKDNTLKQTFKKLRKRGKIVCDEKGKAQMLKGDSARGQLHQEKVYGVIQVPPEEGKGGAETGQRSVIRKFVQELKNTDIENIVDPAVRDVIRQNFNKVGKETIWLNQEKGVPIKRVRVFAHPKVKSLISIRKHRDVSKQGHKSHQMVANGSNYITALYRGVVKGKMKADWKIVSAFEAVKAEREGTWAQLLPDVDEKGLLLKHRLKSGSHVLFWENSADELKTMNSAELSQRLYYVSVMEGARVKFNHHQTALTSNKLGDGESKINFGPLFHNRVYVSVNGINILVQGADFELDVRGRITWRE
ncbi:MAG: type II CRISPR RNA-guided endonuclease Cas9 [Kiritimatiellia bacterium]